MIAVASALLGMPASGEIDFVLDPSPRDIPKLKQTPQVKVQEGPENRIVFIGMDQSRDKLLYGKVPGDKNPFKDLRVRQAIMHAIDREAIAEVITNGSGKATWQMWSAKSPFYVKELENAYPYDIKKAKALLAEAGYPNGIEITDLLLNNSEYRQMGRCTVVCAGKRNKQLCLLHV